MADGNGNGHPAILWQNKVDVEKAFGVEFGQHQNVNVFCPFCEDPEKSSSPSCSVSVDGLFNCKSCYRSGSAVDFYAQRERVMPKLAYSRLKSGARLKGKRPPKKPARKIDDALVEESHRTLMRSTVKLAYLMSKRRGLTEETIKRFKLGCDEIRITIPVYTTEGQLYAIRRYLPHRDSSGTDAPKFVWHEGGQTAPILYPAQLLPDYSSREVLDPLLLSEGEFDCLLLIQNGFDALTVTSGVSTWFPEFTETLKDLARPVVLIYDVNDTDADLGQRIAHERAAMLTDAGLECKVVRLPLTPPEDYVGGDVTDFFNRFGGTAQELQDLIQATPVYDPENEAEVPDIEAVQTVEGLDNSTPVTLSEATRQEYFYKPIKLRCLVAGKGSSPYLVPKHITIDVVDKEGGTSSYEKKFTGNDPIILALMRCDNARQKAVIKSAFGLDPKAPTSIQVLEAMNIEELHLIPALDLENDQGPYVLRQAYYVGHGIETNRVYDFTGYTLPDPQTQSATHILVTAKPAETDLENFQLSPEMGQRLRETFSTEDVYGRLDDIAENLATYITKIFGRSDLHIALDLVYHSPLGFEFDNTRVRKGWLECLVLGDTRTGKGFVAEGLSRHYGVGEVVSGENLTFAGLIAAVQKVGDRFTLVWGKVPLNDQRLIILDECGGLTHSDISKLSRIRSEGIAEVTKAISERTRSRTRLIWLANPRANSEGNARVMHDYTYGIEAVPEFIGTAEDVARFDYVLIVTKGEVPSKEINSHREEVDPTQMPYPSDLCKQLIMWVWSRQPEDIVFDDGVVPHVLKAAQSLGSMFSTKICLIQSEDVRFKIIRIACAAACRTFSTTDFKTVTVTKKHVDFAYNFLIHIYSKASSGYAQLSAAEKERNTLRNPKAIIQTLQVMRDGQSFEDLVMGLLETSKFNSMDVCDFSGADPQTARQIISELFRARAIRKEGGYYVKQPSFKRFLQEIKSRLQVGQEHFTEDDNDADQ